MTEGKVAKILSSSRMVINLGSSDSIEVGNEFEAYEMGDEIVDPDSGDSMGNLEILKGKFVVVSTQEKMSVLEKKKRTVTKTRYVNDFARAFSIFGGREEHYDVSIPEEIKLENSNSDYEQRLVVRVGDKVRLVGMF